MNRVRIAAVAAGLTVAMVVGVLVGGAMSTANAEGDGLRPPVTGNLVRPVPADPAASGVPSWVLDAWAERDAANKGAAEEGEGEAVVCPLETGCTVNVVDADGNVVKVMNITFSDPEDADSVEVSE